MSAAEAGKRDRPDTNLRKSTRSSRFSSSRDCHNQRINSLSSATSRYLKKIENFAEKDLGKVYSNFVHQTQVFFSMKKTKKTLRKSSFLLENFICWKSSSSGVNKAYCDKQFLGCAFFWQHPYH